MTEHDDALPELDLGVLAEGVGPSAGQWEAIGSIAAHRRRRRSMVLSAAAVLILVAGTATVLLSRKADDGVQLATGGTSGAQYVIPPDGVSLVSSSMYPARGGFVIRYDDGRWAWTLESHPMTTVEPFIDSTEVPRDDARLDQATIDSQQFGAVRLLCRAVEVGEYGYTAERALTLLLGAEWQFEGHLVILRADLSARQGPSEGCSDSLEAPTLAAQIDQLRVVSEAELRQYLSIDDGEVASPSTSTPPPLQLSTTTTVPEGDPAELGDARVQIEAAVRGFNVPSADGTWPYLEDGVARAEEYRERQELAWEQSGLTAMGDRADMVQEVVSISFESPTSAQVDFQITVTLQSGRQTWPHHGRFILEDGVWKMSRESNLQISGLACSAPQPDAESCGTTGG
jgi:hypothetical protein